MKFEELCRFIKDEYPDHISKTGVRDEDEFNTSLVSSLKGRVGVDAIDDSRRRHRQGDIAAYGNYVFELKYAKKEGTLSRGLTELKRYKAMENYKKICVVILDVQKIPDAIDEHRRYYENEGARVIVIKGKAR